MVREHGDVLCIMRLHLEHDGLHGDISIERECYSLVEDTLTSTKHGC
jgi:hypothetical protein